MALPCDEKSFSRLLLLVLQSIAAPSPPPPWPEAAAALLPGAPAPAALAFCAALQRAFARATCEQWAPPQLEAHLVGAGFSGAHAAAAGAAWARERGGGGGGGAAAAAAARALPAPAPTLAGAPTFAVVGPVAASDGAVGGEPAARLTLPTSGGVWEVAADRGALAAAAAALAGARRALGAGAAVA
jgi:hypothetical protein